MNRRGKPLLLGVYSFTLFVICNYFFSLTSLPYIWNENTEHRSRATSEVYLRRGPFETYEFSGFANTGQLSKQSCDAFRHNGTVAVQKSIHLQDNLRQVAAAVDGHERIDYRPEDLEDPNLSAEALVDKMWHQMSGSSVWLADLNVFLLVTRVFFGENIFWPTISFLRGRLFDEDWNELHNYTIHWEQKSYMFPLVFQIEAPFTIDGVFFGPEDPRIIVEDGVEGAEPVIVFNMVGPITEWKRAMYIFRPFSDKLTLLTIGKLRRPDMEKNWAPFFVPQYNSSDALTRQPNEYIHFVYNHKPVRILRCHLRCGDCDFVFEQQVPADILASRREGGGDLRGGSNFMPVPVEMSPSLQRRVDIWVVLPRTHIETVCGALYRPELVIMIRVDSHFYMAFASNSLEFGNAVVEYGPEDDRCSKGRIMIPMSLARWDIEPNLIEVSTEKDSTATRRISNPAYTDILTFTLSVDDTSVRVARMSGLLEFVKNIPQVKALLKMNPAGTEEDTEFFKMHNLLSTWVADDIRGCLIEAAINYTSTLKQSGDAEPARPDERKKLLLKEYEEKNQAKLLAEGKLGPEPLGLSQIDELRNSVLADIFGEENTHFVDDIVSDESQDPEA